MDQYSPMNIGKKSKKSNRSGVSYGLPLKLDYEEMPSNFILGTMTNMDEIKNSNMQLFGVS